jgi:hypothetical protein
MFSSMGDLALQRMLADACLGSRSDAEFTRDLRGYLARHAVAEEDIDALCAGPARLSLYRRLVRNNLEHVVGQMMPRAKARLDALAGGAFDASLAAFLDEVGPRTHHLRDVPAEFLAWARDRWPRDPRIPPWMIDLATHEHVEFLVGAAPLPASSPPLGEVALDKPLVFTEVRRLVRYAFAVHELPEVLGDDTVPAARSVVLLAYRDERHEVRFLELTAVAAAILERLFAGDTLKDALTRACQFCAVPLDDALLAGAARLLADLGERGVLLGAAS